jgi:hypothetical protein
MGQILWTAPLPHRLGLMLQPNSPTLLNYYGRLIRRFRQEIRKAWWESVLAIIAIVVVLFLQFYLGWIKKGETTLTALVNISPYIAILIAYTIRHVIRAPWLLDTERGNEIETLSEKLEEFSSESNRPRFKFTKPTVIDAGELDEDERYSFSFNLENVGSREAVDVITRVIVTEAGNTSEPRILELAAAGNVLINDPFITQFELRHSHSDPPIQVVVALKFKDSITGQEYTQAFYMKWAGVRLGNISQIFQLTSQEHEELMQRLGNLSDFN